MKTNVLMVLDVIHFVTFVFMFDVCRSLLFVIYVLLSLAMLLIGMFVPHYLAVVKLY